MPKFRKKPMVVEARRYDGGNHTEIVTWTGYVAYQKGDGLFVLTLEGTLEADPGDWIIQGVKGEFYPCKPGVFEQTYEPVEDAD